MRLHLELRAEANRAHGMSAEDAAYAAKRRFGNVTLLREDGREAWGWLFLDRLGQDLRYGARQLLRHRTSTMAVILTLALGIGANTAMFTLLNAALFAPAPAAHPDRLVWLGQIQQQSGRFHGVSFPDYQALRDHGNPFVGLAAYSSINVSLGGGAPERVRSIIASGNYFDVLGVPVAHGRTFRADEDARPGAHPVVVVSHALWTRRFGADPSILNQSIVINGRPFTVIGVAPPRFSGIEIDDEPVGLWMPLAMIREAMPGQESRLGEANVAWLRVVARLAPGASLAQADAAVRSLSLPSRASRLASMPESLPVALPIAGGFDPGNQRDLAPVLGLLMVVPALVLLIACANAANLLLARGIDRRKELALRRSLGASRNRLVRQLLTESVMLASIAGGLGIYLAHAFVRVIGSLAQMPATMLASFTIDSRVLVATSVIAVGTGLLFGLAPAFAASNPPILPALKEDGLTVTPGRRSHRIRSTLVVAQVAVSLVLLVACGLFLRSMTRALQVDPGFDTQHGLAYSFDLNLQGYAPERRSEFVRQLVDATTALPGVESAAVITTLPLGGRFTGNDVMREVAAPLPENESHAGALFASISPAYFSTMGISLSRGRPFNDHDTSTSTPVVVINERLAGRLWTNEDPLGKRLRMEGDNEPWREVVGVVVDSKDDDLTNRPRPFFYLPLSQEPSGELFLVARTASDPRPVLREASAVAHAIDPDLPLIDVRTFQDLISNSVNKFRAISSLLAVFGALALILATMGLYAVAAHATTLRTREVSIRMALGATTVDVQRLFLREGLGLAIIGVAVGLMVSAVSATLIASFVFGLGISDVVVFAASAVVLGLVALLASYLPARRAARVDPNLALRNV